MIDQTQAIHNNFFSSKYSADLEGCEQNNQFINKNKEAFHDYKINSQNWQKGTINRIKSKDYPPASSDFFI